MTTPVLFELDAEPALLTSHAVLSDCGQYRYSLTRRWNAELPRLLWVMLNPSVADATADDPTIRRCVGFAKGFGYGALEVVNLFAYRATDPKKLLTAADPIGRDNDGWINLAARCAGRVIVAWGATGDFKQRRQEVLRILRAVHPQLYCLGTTKSGEPRHPCRLPKSVELMLYEEAGENDRL